MLEAEALKEQTCFAEIRRWGSIRIDGRAFRAVLRAGLEFLKQYLHSVQASWKEESLFGEAASCPGHTSVDKACACSKLTWLISSL